MSLLPDRPHLSRALALIVLATVVAAPGPALDYEIPEVSFQSFRLDNGLTVIVHEDRKAPIVAVNVWYHVGSKNEQPGKTGFAHLFEHLMFNGSENFDDDYFKVVERAGATELNGTTWLDRTNYFQNVPTNALDLALWMESDRMGHLLGAISQEKLDEQRSVVQNEKRQGENQPYARVWSMLPGLAYPSSHPYSWETIGSMADLNAASLDDVKQWFGDYYGAANAVLVLAGDIDVETARAKTEHYFGDIAPGPPVAKQRSWVAARTGSQRVSIQDRVPQARVYRQWNVPEWGTAANDYLQLLADVLASGKNSRLYRRLVYEEQVATDVSAWVFPFEIGGQFMITATARPGGDLEQLERLLDEELERLLSEGPADEELERVKIQIYADFVRGLEGVGGFGGKSDLLARNQVYGGDPGYYKITLGRQLAATPAAVREVGAQWLADGMLAIAVTPFPDLAAAGEGADRSRLPATGEPLEVRFPEVTRSRLSNGIEVLHVERTSAPLVELQLILDAGYAADQGGLPGTASLAMDMLDEGAAGRSALEISEQLSLLGAELVTGSTLDSSFVRLSALTSNLPEALAVFADVVLRPDFPAAELERLKQEQIARIQREKSTPIQLALRVFPRLVYGEGHAYSLPLTGSGTETAVEQIDVARLREFHRTWFRPGGATVVAVGDIGDDELTTLLESSFADWAGGEVPPKNIATVAHREAPAVYLMDRPGSEQSVIFAGHVAPPRSAPNDLAIETMNTILGGDFTSRINMNLREDKGWAYGAGTFVPGARGQRPFIAYAPVQTDKTKESMTELLGELRGIGGPRPISDDEIEKVKDSQTLTLAGQWETNADVAAALAESVRFDLADDYHDTYAARVRGLERSEIESAAAEVVRPGSLIWVVVGDREQIEAGIRELELGPIEILDADGRPLSEGG